MSKRVVLIVGTPCTGKTTLAKQLAIQLKAKYINLTEYAKTKSLVLRQDKQRNTLVINEGKMKTTLAQEIKQTETDIIIDGHYASAVVPQDLATHVIVLRKNPKELKLIMQKNGFQEAKINENIEAEILDVCLVEALELQGNRVCELDATGKTVQQIVDDVLAVLNGQKACAEPSVDWLAMLEREGLADKYLKG